jgi:hypothetical protein
MPVLVPIVEGDGEVQAVPILLRAICSRFRALPWRVATPKNAHGCDNLMKAGGLERFVELAWRQRDCGGVLVLLDSDGRHCPMTLAQSLRARIRQMGPRHSVSIVVAHHEYEAWFLASLDTIVGRRFGGHHGLRASLSAPPDCESVQNPKQWLSRRFPGGRIYKETSDQAAMTTLIDHDTARARSRSFRRLYSAVEKLLAGWHTGSVFVSP